MGFSFACENVSCHFASLYAQFVVVNTEGCSTASFNHTTFTANYGKFCFFSNDAQSRHCGSQNVVGRNVESIYFANQATSSLLNVVYGRNGSFFDFYTFSFSSCFQDVNLQLRVNFTGAVNGTNSFCIGNQFKSQIKLSFDGVHIGSTSYVGTRFFIVFYKFSYYIVSNSSTYDRNIRSYVSHGLSCRSSDCANQVNFIAYKTLSNILQVGLVSLCILSIKSNVLTFFITFRSQAIYEAFVSSIESRMFYQLANTNSSFSSSFGSFFFVAATACHQAHSQSKHNACGQHF